MRLKRQKRQKRLALLRTPVSGGFASVPATQQDESGLLQYQQHNAQLQECLKQYTQDNEQLRNSLSRIQQKNEQLQNSLNQLQQKKDSLQEDLNEKADKVLSLQQSLMNAWEEKHQVELARESDRVEQKLMSSKFVAVTNARIEQTKKYREIVERCKEIQKQLAEQKTALTQLNALKAENRTLKDTQKKLLMEKDKLRFLFRDIGQAFVRHRFYIPYCYKTIRAWMGFPVEKKQKAVTPAKTLKVVKTEKAAKTEKTAKAG